MPLSHGILLLVEIPVRNLVSASDTAGTLNYELLTAGLT